MDNVNALRSIAEMPINLSVEQIGALQAGIKALQEQAEREKGCNGCAHNGLYENEIEYGYPSPCTGCQRR